MLTDSEQTELEELRKNAHLSLDACLIWFERLIELERKDAVEMAAEFLKKRAAEFEACNNTTAGMMARIYRDEADTISKLPTKPEPICNNCLDVQSESCVSHKSNSSPDWLAELERIEELLMDKAYPINEISSKDLLRYRDMSELQELRHVVLTGEDEADCPISVKERLIGVRNREKGGWSVRWDGDSLILFDDHEDIRIAKRGQVDKIVGVIDEVGNGILSS